MPGSPKKRARREAHARSQAANTRRTDPHPPTKQPAGIPDALPAPDPLAHNARARARASEPPTTSYEAARDRPRPLRGVQPGPHARAFADLAQTDSARQVAEHIRPGVTIRIDRVRPQWAAGFIEDYTIESEDAGGGLAELYEYLRDEHGGARYRITVITAGDTPLYVGSIPIAGPVRDKGRVITRESWDPPSRERVERAPAPAQASSGAGVGELVSAMGTFLQMFMTQQQHSADSQLQAVRDMVASQQKQTADLTTAVLRVRADERERGGIGGQVTELVRGVREIEKARKAFGAAAGPATNSLEDEGMLDSVVKEATRSFVGQAVPALMQRMVKGEGGATASVTKPNQSVVPPRPISSQRAQSQRPGIPDAIASQTARKN